jgi:hypothetical protein
MYRIVSTNQWPKRGGFFTPRPEKSFSRFAPPRKKLSPLRPAPLSQGIFTNSTDTKDRNGKEFLLPTPLRPEKSFPRLPRPVSSFYFSSPLRPAPPKMVPAPFRSRLRIPEKCRLRDLALEPVRPKNFWTQLPLAEVMNIIFFS